MQKFLHACLSVGADNLPGSCPLTLRTLQKPSLLSLKIFKGKTKPNKKKKKENTKKPTPPKPPQYLLLGKQCALSERTGSCPFSNLAAGTILTSRQTSSPAVDLEASGTVGSL